MSIFIVGAKHYNSVQNSIAFTIHSPHNPKIYWIDSLGFNLDKKQSFSCLQKEIARITGIVKYLNIASVAYRYNDNKSPAEIEVLIQDEIEFQKDATILRVLNKFALHKAISLILSQLATGYLPRELTKEEQNAIQFFRLFLDYLANEIVTKDARYEAEPFEIV